MTELSEKDIRKHAKCMINYTSSPCSRAKDFTGITFGCDKCPYFPEEGCMRKSEEEEVEAAKEWLLAHPEKRKYAFQKFKKMPSWVQIGIKCRFWNGEGNISVEDYLAGYRENHTSPFLSSKDVCYRFAEPVIDNKKIPKEGEPVACWANGNKTYIVIPARTKEYNGYDVWDHVTSYHGQLNMDIEALKDEIVYK